MTTRSLSVAALAALFATSTASADDLLPPDRPIEQVIDHYVGARCKDEKVTPAPLATDAELLRRITLDLVGRIPTDAEARAYATATDLDKKVKLVERLLGSPGYARHQATEFDAFLMGGTRSSIRDYLVKAFDEGRPWDRIYRELMLPEQTEPAAGGRGRPGTSPAEFLRARVTDADKLTSEVSVRFFGVNVSCAQCHDHPHVPDWKQGHYFGMKSFLARTFDNGGYLAERGYGVVKYKTTKGQEHQAKLMFLTGEVIEDKTVEPSTADQKKEKEQFEQAKKDKKAPPKPAFSAREQLVDLSLREGQRDFFARSVVNRIWARLFGYGLVMPLDQMHSENPASHPELLDWLARDLIAHKYDLKRLTRGLVLSEAYARSSKWDGESSPKPQLFALANVRPLTPMQLAVSLRVATTDPQALPATLKPEEFEKKIEALEQSARGFAPLIEYPGESFQVGVGEALLFSNGDRVQKELLVDASDRLLGRLKQLKTGDEVIDMAVRAILSRPPTADEKQVLGDYLRRRADRPAEGVRQMVWALLTCSEFRFNY